MLAVYGCLSLMEGKPEYLKKLEEVLDGICEEECWALPAHINRKEDPQWSICVDLFASETAHALSEIISGLKGRLPSALCEKVRENVFRRVLTPFMNAAAPYAKWEGGDNNWNAVCCGSIGCAAIYLMQDEPELLKPLLDRIVCSLDSYIAGFSEDGACMEGLGYFTYGMTYYTGFADMLYRYTDGAIDLMEDEKCRRIAMFQQKCYFPSGRTLSFSDGDSRDTYKMGLTCFLAMRYAGVEIPPISCAGVLMRTAAIGLWLITGMWFGPGNIWSRRKKGCFPLRKTMEQRTVLCCPEPSGVSAEVYPAEAWRQRAEITGNPIITMMWEASCIWRGMKCS